MCYQNVDQYAGAMMKQHMGFTQDANGNMIPPGKQAAATSGKGPAPAAPVPLTIPAAAATDPSLASSSTAPDPGLSIAKNATQLAGTPAGAGLNVP